MFVRFLYNFCFDFECSDPLSTNTVLLGQLNRMIWPIQPYELANPTLLSDSFYAVENIVLRRGLFFSTAGKQFASPLPSGTALASAAARYGI